MASAPLAAASGRPDRAVMEIFEDELDFGAVPREIGIGA
jgi:hypothetical protein